MRALKSIIAAALVAFSATALAQTYTDKDGAEYEFKKHLFVNVAGGAQYTLGEAAFGDLLSPNVQVALGWQVTPWFATRLQANAWQSKGGWSNYRDAQGSPAYTADYKFKYVAPGLDFMFNLSNAFCGYNPNRVFNVTAFLGGGVNIAFDNDEVNAIAAQLNRLDAYNLEYLWDGTKTNVYGRGGVELSFRVSNAVSIIVEGNANVLSDHYNSKKAGNADWYFNALAGLRINLGKTYTKKEPVKEEPVAVEPAPVAPVVKPAPVVEEVKKVEPLRRDIFFKINSSKIADSETVKVRDIVAYLNANPNAKITITGYADAGTGNDRVNDRLAKERAESVVNTLTTQYAIAADRITSDSKGAREQPFAENDMNRVSICIAE